MRYTPALAHAADSCLNAARSGCPSAKAAADIRYARALVAAQAEQAEADYQADPAGYEAHHAHNDALAADAYYYPAA